jgi:hypothetical protein
MKASGWIECDLPSSVSSCSKLPSPSLATDRERTNEIVKSLSADFMIISSDEIKLSVESDGIDPLVPSAM